MTKLLLIRHGQTDWNLEGKYTGQADVPLNETGRAQAYEAAEFLKQVPIDAIVSSDLMRALETAAIVAGSSGCDVHIQTDPRLREIHQGVWQGMHFNEIKRRYGAEFSARKANPLDVAPPGGETVGEVRERVIDAIRSICKQYPDGVVVIVAHGLALAIVRCWLTQHPITDVWSLIPPNAKVIRGQYSVPSDSSLLVAAD